MNQRNKDGAIENHHLTDKSLNVMNPSVKEPLELMQIQGGFNFF